MMRPPSDEIRRFFQLEAKIRRCTNVSARGALEADALFNSVVARAFSGGLSA